ncbi:cyclic pyranopterin monophosphate synthase MoaC [Pleomorphomonas sp. PLEO]|uniref:cyclic pyranopterin monophosphate synthase MoaC n=1 Tax=Pleomorphomonas sp. PLEO TaxID=3239306 RepID=UPI00351E8B03
MKDGLSHLDDKGAAHMVDVGEKGITQRAATASGRVIMTAETLALIVDGRVPKGDVIATARLAGIMAAKKTADLIPLCHPLALSGVVLDLEPDPALPGIAISATVRCTGRTGVEMEALTAVSVACLTIYDMVKAVEKGVCIEAIRLVEKSGGKSGHWLANA